MPTSTKWSPAKFKERLEKEVKTYNKKAVADLCEQLTQHLSQRPTPYPEKEALEILNLLRRKRMFALMQTVADALIQSGQDAFGVRRQYAQSLIDQGNMTAANAVLDALISDTTADSSEKAAKENAEARGLRGRVYKQLYINAQDRTSARSQEQLKQAVRWYFDVYTSDPAKHIWHGINVAALLQLGRRAGIQMEGFPAAEEIAQGILNTIEAKKDKADQWDFATAVEACVALDKPVEAKRWLGKYVKSQSKAQNQYADAFELASTLRQFEEVWQLDIKSEMGKQILPVLRAELLEREGGQVKLSVEDLRPENRNPLPDKKGYESMFGNAALDSYKSLQIGMARARAVARIWPGLSSPLSKGTGFLVKGEQLSKKFGKGLVLLTNAHVVSDNDNVRQAYGSLHPSEAVITFEALGTATYKVKKLLWTSEPTKLDATILELDKPVKKSDLYPLADVLPVVNPEARIYIIGHPAGGELTYSIQDNLLLDHQDPPGFIHYRTPTKPGSSGSPVFNRNWDLIGLHHAGSPDRPKLNKKKGTYEANEGIWIRAIIRALEELSG